MAKTLISRLDIAGEPVEVEVPVPVPVPVPTPVPDDEYATRIMVERPWTSITSSTVTFVAKDALAYYDELESVDFPNLVELKNYAFYYCISLTSVNLPKCQIVGASAFADCTAITSIDLPSCTSVGDSAFGWCNVLNDVTIGTNESTEVATGGSRMFRNSGALTSIYVADSLVNAYKTAPNWSDYANRIKGISEKTV